MERFTAEQDKMLPEKRTLVITHFPKCVHMVLIYVCNAHDSHVTDMFIVKGNFANSLIILCGGSLTKLTAATETFGSGSQLASSNPVITSPQ